METAAPSPRVLIIGLDPYRVPGPWDPEPKAVEIDRGVAQFVENGIGVETCLFGLDGSDDITEVVGAALRERPWECVVVGGGVRASDAQPPDPFQLELFEKVINLVHQVAPQAAIAFSATADSTFDAASRWLGASGSVQPE